MRIAFLGPAGTFSEDALRAAVGGAEIDARPAPTVYEAIRAVAEGEAERALVPFENSIEGAVRSTLDTLAFDAPSVTIAGEHDHPITNSLIAREGVALERVEVVLSHPQASGQCARFIREQLPRAQVRAAASTAEAVREVSASPEPWAALGAASAAHIYGCVVLREGVEDTPDNVTRFVWIAPAGTRSGGEGPWRTTLVFSELGADHPGALVEALTEFSRRQVNLSRIESRPRRRGLGRYMFFIDLDGAEDEPAVAQAIEALRGKAESVRILGSYPVAANGIPGA
jgi:prephenate dehydratase